MAGIAPCARGGTVDERVAGVKIALPFTSTKALSAANKAKKRR